MFKSTTFVMPVLFSLRKELEINCINNLTRQIIKNNNFHNKFYVTGHKDNIEFLNWQPTNNLIQKIQYNTKYSISESINIVAKQCDTEFFCFIHPDVFVYDDDWINKFQKITQVLPKCGTIGIQNHSDFKEFSIKILPEIYQVLTVDAIMFFRTELFEEIGLFSKKFLADCESGDFNYKALRAGFKNYWIDPASIPAEHFVTPFKNKMECTDELLSHAKNSTLIFREKWWTFKEEYIKNNKPQI